MAEKLKQQLQTVHHLISTVKGRGMKVMRAHLLFQSSFCCSGNHHDQSNLEGLIHLPLPGYFSSLKEVITGTLSGVEAETVKECCSLACFLIQIHTPAFSFIQVHVPGNGVAHSSLGPLTPISQNNLSQA